MSGRSGEEEARCTPPLVRPIDLASGVQDRVHIEVVARGIPPIVELVDRKLTDSIPYQINLSNDPRSSRVRRSQIRPRMAIGQELDWLERTKRGVIIAVPDYISRKLRPRRLFLCGSKLDVVQPDLSRDEIVELFAGQAGKPHHDQFGFWSGREIQKQGGPGVGSAGQVL